MIGFPVSAAGRQSSSGRGLPAERVLEPSADMFLSPADPMPTRRQLDWWWMRSRRDTSVYRGSRETIEPLDLTDAQHFEQAMSVVRYRFGSG